MYAPSTSSSAGRESFRTHLRLTLAAQHGEMIGGDRLRHTLGFTSISGLNMAIARNTLELPTFRVAGRRGRFALTQDVADWLVLQRDQSQHQKPLPVPMQFRNSKVKAGGHMSG